MAGGDGVAGVRPDVVEQVKGPGPKGMGDRGLIAKEKAAVRRRRPFCFWGMEN